MDDKTAQMLSRLTREFYSEVASSFSATREAPWQGWRSVADEVGPLADGASLKILDLACGNLRFERFLVGAFPDTPLDVHAYDECDPLVGEADIPGATVHFRHLDVAETLFAHGDLGDALGAEECDLAVCFGFMHHVPLPAQRESILATLVEAVRPGGLVAVSFWQLSNSPRLLKKAEEVTALASERLDIEGLAKGDYLLGWQDRTDVLRYCHDFDEEEVDALAGAVSPAAREAARFSADGKEGNLNRYLILMRL
ncbi:MAG: class I SAM-dependent methyltransferase [Atopobiaceae bacterium]|nr:class I SAM-dependent methyltransferase [Atopobiaceae bacterium]